MGISKAQKLRFILMCQCGCGELFAPFPVYKKGVKGLYYAKYKRGHHPNTRKTQTNNKTPWNKGLTKDHPTVARICFQKGHKPFNDFSKINARLKADKEFKDKWRKAKSGKTPWNKFLTKSEYPNGIKNGPEHGNWKYNKRGPADLAKMKEVKKEVLARDNYTCQYCGDTNFKGRGSSCRLEVHHIISIAEDQELCFSLENMVTLCHNCHIKTDNYGTKVVTKIRKQSGK